VVYEFPELQGTMGRIYAYKEQLPADVCESIFEHYLPRFPGDQLPLTDAGAVVALADKMDSICACFSAGLIPSGSQDPYALRRAAMGIVAILLHKQWRIDLQEWLGDRPPSVLDFLKQRFLYILQEEKKVDYDIAGMVLGMTELNKAVSFAELYQKERGNPDFMRLVQSAVRIGRLAGDTGDAGEPRESVLPELFQESIEHEFWDAYRQTCAEVKRLESKQDYPALLFSLMETVPMIEDYFVKVLVMDKEARVKTNRLTVLHHWKILFWRYGDWERVVQKIEK